MISENRKLELERIAFQQNREIFRKVQSNLLAVVSLLTHSNGEEVEMVLWSQMEKLPLHHKIFLGEAWFEKQYCPDPDTMVFTCTMVAGTELSRQAHDFVEKIQVIRGEFIDFVTDKVYKEGEKAIFKIHQVHKPASKIETELVVTMHRYDRSTSNLISSGKENES